MTPDREDIVPEAPNQASALPDLVYRELRRMASGLLRNENRGVSVSTSTLVHETFLRLAKSQRMEVKNRAYFFGAAARAMRRILVEDARARTAKKRLGGVRIEFSPEMAVTDPRKEDLVAIDTALNALAELDVRKARVVELRFFGGLSVAEAAEVLDISERTIKREWLVARAWLREKLE